MDVCVWCVSNKPSWATISPSHERAAETDQEDYMNKYIYVYTCIIIYIYIHGCVCVACVSSKPSWAIGTPSHERAAETDQEDADHHVEEIALWHVDMLLVYKQSAKHL